MLILGKLKLLGSQESSLMRKDNKIESAALKLNNIGENSFYSMAGTRSIKLTFPIVLIFILTQWFNGNLLVAGAVITLYFFIVSIRFTLLSLKNLNQSKLYDYYEFSDKHVTLFAKSQSKTFDIANMCYKVRIRKNVFDIYFHNHLFSIGGDHKKEFEIFSISTEHLNSLRELLNQYRLSGTIPSN